jgi:hypothetical protein
MQPSSWPPIQPAPPQFIAHKTPGAVIGFRIFAGFYTACALFMALYGVARVTGWDYKLGLRAQTDTEPVDEGDLAVTLIFAALGIVMLTCAFLPARPWSWGVGLAALILGLPCCLAPAVILLVLWCQMPTRLYFMTHGWRNLPQPMQPYPPVPPMS